MPVNPTSLFKSSKHFYFAGFCRSIRKWFTICFFFLAIGNISFCFQSCRKTDASIPWVEPAKPGEHESDGSGNADKWPASPAEVIIHDLNWIFPWYNSIEISDFSKKLPAGVSFKVYIQRGNSTDWIEVPFLVDNAGAEIKYEYFVETRPLGAGMYHYGSLYIFYYGQDVSDHPSVKIVY